MQFWNYICISCLFSVLFFQLSVVSAFSFSVSEIFFGDITYTTKQTTPAQEKVAAPLPALTVASKNETYDEIMFVGDVLLARNVEYLMDTIQETYPFDGYTIKEFAVNPAVVINFESSIPENHVQTLPYQLKFSTQKKFLKTLRNFGVTHASLANNHSYDFGASAFMHTESSLEEYDITTFGSPNDITKNTVSYIELENQTIALIGISAINAKVDKETLKQLFTTSAMRSDVQFVFVHWGDEYIDTSNEFQHEYAAELVAYGADAIIGHHPHVVQEISTIKGVPVFYSLGNYIFDQYADAAVQTGLVLRYAAEETPGFYLQPVTSVSSKSQPRPLETSAHAAFLYDLAARSDIALEKFVTTGFVPLKTVATSTKIAIIY